MSQKFFIETMGCQMNIADSERMREMLGQMGYTAAATASQASLIVVNTCSVREKAEEKLMSALGRYRELKEQTGARIGVTGCVAQQAKTKLLERAPHIDFILGTDAVARLPKAIAALGSHSAPVVDTAWMDSAEYVFPQAQPSGRAVTAFVTVMKGCDNVCAFCIVPQTRGREVSRAWEEVLAEVARHAAHGVREVTLLGQNVNSYRGGVSFAHLLRRVARVEGIARIRFTTSHPHDLSDELIEAFADEPKIMPHFHLPVQSGSDAVLRRMRRDYTALAYRSRVAKLRNARPDIAVTTDVIVGFPGESEEDFAATHALCEEVEFDGLFAFAYSRRPRTVAALKEAEWGVIPHEIALERLNRLLALQRRQSQAAMHRYLGKQIEVLVEGPSRTNAERQSGRSPHNRVVNFDGAANAGEIARILVSRASHSALSGKVAASA